MARATGRVLMTGPVATSFRGEVGAVQPMSRVEILTFGCRLNTFESEVIRGHRRAPRRHGGRQHLRRHRRGGAAGAPGHRPLRAANGPARAIVVTGCAAQIDPARWAALPGVRRVLGNVEKLQPESWQPGAGSAGRRYHARRRSTAAQPVTGIAGRARAFLDVQQGCDHACTFCIIPQGRGPAARVPVADVVGHCGRWSRPAINEIVLTGVDLASYGADLPGAVARRSWC